ncbi:N-acetylneuraminate synthase [Planctomycetota bacterium]
MSTSHVYIIAEAGVNHNGSLSTAKKLVDAAADSGADAVKFQTFRSESMTSAKAPKADYQKASSNSAESQLDMLRRLELKEDDFRTLNEYCVLRDVQFLSSPFDLESVDLLTRALGLTRVKLPSGEITNAPLLLKIAQSGSSVIVSTGMSTLAEVEMALSVLAFGYAGEHAPPSRENFCASYRTAAGRRSLEKKVVLMQCTTEYPAPFPDVNLLAMDTLAATFELPVGVSDHTPGIEVAIAAVARGATFVEKHLTLDKNMPGPDHSASLVPNEFKSMAEAIRNIEEAFGSAQKAPALSELKNRDIVRKSLVAAKRIQEGELFTEQNLVCKRPGTGVSPMQYWELLGKTSGRDYDGDEMVVI